MQGVGDLGRGLGPFVIHSQVAAPKMAHQQHGVVVTVVADQQPELAVRGGHRASQVLGGERRKGIGNGSGNGVGVGIGFGFGGAR